MKSRITIEELIERELSNAESSSSLEETLDMIAVLLMTTAFVGFAIYMMINY